MAEATRACIYVLAGNNGSGKSSIGGAKFLEFGTEFFNPDEVAQTMRAADSNLDQAEANSRAWHEGRRLLERSIAEKLTFAFETTLGGNTIPQLLEQATASGLDVRIWYVGLEGVDLHIARVRARVRKGGHDIPEERIRERYDTSRSNLIRLMPQLAELRLHDNTSDADPNSGASPEPLLVLHMIRGRIEFQCPVEETPNWAKPIVTAAMRARGIGRRRKTVEEKHA